MNVPHIQNSFPWVSAHNELREVRPDIADALDEFYRSLPKPQRASLSVAIAEYRYADKVIDDSHPLWPDRTEIPPEYVCNGTLPVGIILSNCCEVSDFIFIGERLEQVSQALLFPGDGIGLFELADYLTGVPRPPEPHWHITAGATSTYVLPNLTTTESRKKIRAQLGEDVDPLKLKEATSFTAQIMGMKLFESIRQGWHVRILYFSAPWFERMRHNPGRLGLKAEAVFTRRAWKAYARIRMQRSNLLGEALNEVAKGGNQIHLAQSAVPLLTSLEDILAARRPCFVPVDADTPVGPFGAISSHVIAKMFDGPPCILIPTYLSEDTKIGFVKLDHATPALLSSGATSGARDKIVGIIRMLRAAAQRRARSDKEYGLKSYVDLLSHLMFQSPPAKKSSKFYNVTIDERLANVRTAQLTPQDFYGGLFAVIPRERCAFFRNSICVALKQDGEYSLGHFPSG